MIKRVAVFAALLGAAFTGICSAQPPYQPLPQIIPPVSQDPLDIARRIQQIRNMQIQNARIRQEIEERARRSQAPAPTLMKPDPSNYLTDNLLNCRAWNTGTDAQQLTYIAAVREATLLLLAEMGKLEDIAKYAPRALTNNETTAALGQLCRQPENAPVPVIFVFRLVAMKSGGADPADVERMSAAYRKIALDAIARDGK